MALTAQTKEAKGGNISPVHVTGGILEESVQSPPRSRRKPLECRVPTSISGAEPLSHRGGERGEATGSATLGLGVLPTKGWWRSGGEGLCEPVSRRVPLSTCKRARASRRVV